MPAPSATFRLSGLDLKNYTLEVLRKRIRHVYFRVYPVKEKIIISAPDHLDSAALERVIRSKSAWLKKQIEKEAPPRTGPVPFPGTADSLLFQGELLPVRSYRNPAGRQGVFLNDGVIEVALCPGKDAEQKNRIIEAWLRNELLESTAALVEKWQPVITVTVREFRVRKMRTRWGSCNVQAHRIWINFALVHLPLRFLEYVVVHEMTHLLERKHDARFKSLLDGFLPGWRNLKKEMNRFGL